MTLNSTIFSVCVNIRSVLAHNNTTKLDEIELLATEYYFTVVYLTETWLDNSIDNVTVQLNGYADLFRMDRNRHGGCVLACVKMIFLVFAVSILNRTMLKYSGLGLGLQIFVVFILRCAAFRRILTLFSSKSLPIPYLLF